MSIPAPYNSNRPHLAHPKPLTPLIRLEHYDIYHINIKPIEARLHPNLPKTPLWMYVNAYHTPAIPPVIEAYRDRPALVIWHNQLPQDAFPFDDQSMPMGGHSMGNHCGGYTAMIGDSVVHLHGGVVLPQFDGVPTAPLRPEDIGAYWYPNQQRAATMWFHDHVMDHTAKDVYAGLAGFYLLRDAEEQALNLPADDYEWPLVLQDRHIDAATGQLIYDPNPEFVGDISLVNGQVFPILNAEPTWYRLRLLNGSNTRFYNLKFHVGGDDVSGDINQKPDLDMWQIGTDGGLLSKPAKVPSPAAGLFTPQEEGLLIGPGERIDLVINFERIANSSISLYSDIAAPFGDFSDNKPPEYFHVVAFNIGPITNVSHQFNPRLTLSQITPLPNGQTVPDFSLDESMPGMVTIDGMTYCDATSAKEQVPLNAIQDWSFKNNTQDSHPMHLHLVQFQIQSGGQVLQDIDGNPVLAWKDTARALPGQTLKIRAQFAPFKGRYVYHCHILEHEDAGMMRPLEVI